MLFVKVNLERRRGANVEINLMERVCRRGVSDVLTRSEGLRSPAPKLGANDDRDLRRSFFESPAAKGERWNVRTTCGAIRQSARQLGRFDGTVDARKFAKVMRKLARELGIESWLPPQSRGK